MRYEYLKAAAEAYANLSELESDCYHYLNDGFDTSIQARLVTAYSELLSKAISSKYINKVVSTALAECQYPINESTGYAWSGNERAAFACIPKSTWSNNQLSNHINFIINNMRHNASSANAQIKLQIAGYSDHT